MLPRLIVEGVDEAFHLLTGIAGRARDASPAWDKVADDVFAFNRRWWLTEYGGKRDKEKRPGRNPRYMFQTGRLLASATVRHSPGQVVDVNPHFVFVGVTGGLAQIQENRGRPVIGDPTMRDVDRWTERVGNFIMTGRP
jgi:hypothetical protein